jgi:GTP cyclohydrolase II
MTLNDFDLTQNEILLLKTERAAWSLKNGFPVIIIGTEFQSSVVVFACETLSVRHQVLLQQIEDLSVAISASRASYLFDRKFNSSILIKLKSFSLEEISLLSATAKKSLYRDDYTEGSSIIDHALALSKIAELLPACLIINCNDIFLSEEALKRWRDANQAIELSQKDIYDYQYNNALLLTEICRAPLKLKDVPHACLVAFRAEFGGKEHYAIIIGNPWKTETPSVRIHSSCYMGDLLKVLTCDCGEQLIDAIKFMAAKEENAGILIYLMQEGRGIGFSNTLRTYQLQTEGFDTVEANEILGFEGDERSFILAAKILQILQVNSINLLTNNPRKASEIEKFGIKVAKTTSHQADIHEFNKDKLQVKASKLGHVFCTK